MKKALVLSYTLSEQRRLIRLGGSQADLSRRWAHSHFVGFVMRQPICYMLGVTVNRRLFESSTCHIIFLCLKIVLRFQAVKTSRYIWHLSGLQSKQHKVQTNVQSLESNILRHCPGMHQQKYSGLPFPYTLCIQVWKHQTFSILKIF